ncbi:protein PLASTID MOVEMENT IMPAIRED 1-RELATED 1 [Prunus yedoensis var. nudiflora]|uniref:Protein PLASTID MOVEMENT IMPAIRED 1-RELATED 1 n=1 Tax=Prunus yedoensis var. nudiflora TaxID=2094558 RepID=A0A314ZVX4_PRUYE|nr:protein PLASTID MOVEMENT IMPAIRED 1-RELATED 1 [Prunus yedoensis var. nudiflora]
MEELLRLDAKISGDEDYKRDQILNILAAHHAKCSDLVGDPFRKNLWVFQLLSRSSMEKEYDEVDRRDW